TSRPSLRRLAGFPALAPAGLLGAGTTATPRDQVGGGHRETRVPRFGVFEQTFHWPSGRYSNPAEQVSLAMTVSSPGGARTRVGGFYLEPNTWAARFAPGQAGRWRWTATLGDGSTRSTFAGTFTVGRGGPGFVRRNPYHRYRW